MRWLAITLPLLLAVSPPETLEPPPVALAPYIHDGMFDPGDYHWLRGEFDGADVADKTADAAIVAWRKRCRDSDLAQTRADLAGLGIVAGSSLNSIPYRTLLCNQVASLPEDMDLRDWTGFASDVKTVRPIAQGFLAAARLAERAAAPDRPVLRDVLSSRAAADQVLRLGLGWANSEPSPAPKLPLTPQQRGILTARIAIAMAAQDHSDTEWLKGVVATHGWPKRSEVGDEAAASAWLLVQHADADPAFQARALRLVEPLVARGEVRPKNYAYLYDRVMLKLRGRQRYGSQLTCRAGHYVPQPIEDEHAVDELRKRVGLGSLAEYVRRVADSAGPCIQGPP